MTEHEWGRTEVGGGVIWRCPRCGYRVMFPPGGVPGLGLGLTNPGNRTDKPWYSYDNIAVADSADGENLGRVLRLTEKVRDCDVQLVRSVMDS